MFWVSLQYPYLCPNSKLTLRIKYILIGGDGLYKETACNSSISLSSPVQSHLSYRADEVDSGTEYMYATVVSSPAITSLVPGRRGRLRHRAHVRNGGVSTLVNITVTSIGTLNPFILVFPLSTDAGIASIVAPTSADGRRVSCRHHVVGNGKVVHEMKINGVPNQGTA